ncbi:MAG: hypothetical protein N4A46_04010 [Schleiferiaceae bacterium]|jgi:hypothetical protein|nr:hypothetical protein [Schleiferiaceae bacterium]
MKVHLTKTSSNLHTLIVICLCAFFSTSSLFAQEHHNEIDKKTRKQWIKEMKHSLSSMNPDTVKRNVELKTRDKKGLLHQEYRIVYSGIIHFEQGEWIYVTLNSSHKNPQVGDISMARDQDGKIYYSLGHVCGKIVHYVAQSKEPYSSSSDFIKYFTDDTDHAHWKVLKGTHVPVSEHTH